MHHYLLFYDFAPDYEARRPDFRQSHLQHAWAASERGDLVLAGALTEPLDTGVLLFKGQTRVAAEQFAEKDPYVVNGLVAKWRVREWVTAVGKEAAQPIRAAS